MKKTTAIFAAILTLAACSPKEKFPTPDPDVTYTLEGTVKTDGFGWTSQSEIGIYSMMEGVTAKNVQAKIEGWAVPEEPDPETGIRPEFTPSDYEGKAVAPFNTTETLNLVAGPNKFLIYYPYNPSLAFSKSGVIYDLAIDAAQEQRAANVAVDAFSLAYYDYVPKKENDGFELNPVTATAKITVNTTEFAGYGLKKVSLYDESGEAALGGTFNITVEGLKFETLSKISHVATTIKNVSPIYAGQSQSAYINVMPGDYSGKDLWLVIELSGSKGNVTIPMKRNNLVFKAGQTTEIKVDNLSSRDNVAPWYCPVEPRLLTGAGYAYGDANCYIIQCKSKTYKGASLEANGEYPEQVVIDYRPRGEFSAVEDPAGCTFEWAKRGPFDAGAYNANGTTYAFRSSDMNLSGDDAYNPENGFSFIHDAANYKVTVKNESATAGSPILLMVKNGKILWAWSFWNISADGTKIEALGANGLANMDLGQSSNQYEKWAAVHANNGAFRTSFRFQWGRPVPVFWESYWSLCWIDPQGKFPQLNNSNGQSPAIATTVSDGVSDLSFKETLEHPVGLIYALAPGATVSGPDGHSIDLKNWTKDYYGDLWGGNVRGDIEAEGTKAIYDPCPKGWRVADPKCYAELGIDGEGSGYSYEDHQGYPGIKVNSLGGNLFVTAGYVNGKTATNGRSATMGGAQVPTANNCKYGLIWTSYIGGHTSNQPRAFMFNSSGAKIKPELRTYNRSVAAAVRCQRDTENR